MFRDAALSGSPQRLGELLMRIQTLPGLDVCVELPQQRQKIRFESWPG